MWELLCYADRPEHIAWSHVASASLTESLVGKVQPAVLIALAGKVKSPQESFKTALSSWA